MSGERPREPARDTGSQPGRDAPRDPQHAEEPALWRPARPLPPYAFVPGRTPHPVRDPRGHSYVSDPQAARAERAEVVPSDRWREDECWLVGVDLYNRGFAWEAHEAWEARWLAPADDDQHEFVAALIQVAASVLKCEMARSDRASPEERASDARGGDRLARAALAKLETLAPRVPARYMGLHVVDFAARVRAWASDPARTPESRPRIVLG